MEKMTWRMFKAWVEECGVGNNMVIDSIHTDTTFEEEAMMTVTITSDPDENKPYNADIYIHVKEDDDE